MNINIKYYLKEAFGSIRTKNETIPLFLKVKFYIKKKVYKLS